MLSVFPCRVRNDDESRTSLPLGSEQMDKTSAYEFVNFLEEFWDDHTFQKLLFKFVEVWDGLEYGWWSLYRNERHQWKKKTCI